MNNKDFITALASRLDMDAKDVQRIAGSFITELAENLCDGDSLAIQGFGSFEVRKKMERIVVNPTTKQRMLVPPKLALSFKASQILKEKLKL